MLSYTLEHFFLIYIRLGPKGGASPPLTRHQLNPAGSRGLGRIYLKVGDKQSGQ